MKKVEVGILKHACIGTAEKEIMYLLKKDGFNVRIIDPMAGIYDTANHQNPDILLGRCELNNLTEQAFVAYLTYFDYCESRNIPIINGKNFLLKGQNKFLTHLAVQAHEKLLDVERSINPYTALIFKRSEALMKGEQMIHKFGSVVVKFPESGRGNGIFLVKSVSDLFTLMEECFLDSHPIMLQQTIEKERNSEGGYRDLRIWVCRDYITGKPKVVGSYYRNAPEGQFLTNISQHGYITKYEGKRRDELYFAACYVLDAVDGDVAGIDFTFDKEGNLWFEEVNIAFETGEETLKKIGGAVWVHTVDLIKYRLNQQAQKFEMSKA